MRAGSCIRRRLWGWLRLVFPLMRNSIIALPIEGHHPPDCAHGDILAGQETPEAELASVRMGLLEVLDLDHDREPDLPRGLRPRLAAQQPSKVLCFKAANPAIDRWTRDLHKAADAALRPPLIIEFDHLKAALIALQRAVVDEQGQLTLHRRGALVPELFDRRGVNALMGLVPENPG